MSAAVVRTVVAGAVQVAGNSVQGILGVYWNSSHLSPYGSLLFILAFLFCGFFIVVTALAAFYRDASFYLLADTPAERSLWRKRGGHWTLAQLMFAVSGVNFVAAVTSWYATPPSHTPPLIQAILGSAPIITAIPMSKWVLGDRKRYTEWQPLTAVALVLASIVVSLIPSLVDGSGVAGFGGVSTFGWCLVCLFSQVPTGAALTVQQAFLIRAGALAPGVSRQHTIKVMFRMMMYNQVFVCVYLAACFWLDMLPWFGSSNDVASFSVATRYSFMCSLSGPAGVAGLDLPPGVTCDTAAPLYAGGFILSYMVLLVGVTTLNIDSAVFNAVCFVMNTMVQAVFWFIPGTNPDPAANPPVWSVVVALVLSLAGVVLFKAWELRTPAHDQFQLADSVPAAPGAGTNADADVDDADADAADGFKGGRDAAALGVPLLPPPRGGGSLNA